MSTIKVNSIEPAVAGSESYVIAKVACRYNPGVPVLQWNHGMSSLTDVAAGQFQVNYSNSFSANDYACAGAMTEVNNNTTLLVVGIDFTLSTTALGYVRTSSSAAANAEEEFSVDMSRNT